MAQSPYGERWFGFRWGWLEESKDRFRGRSPEDRQSQQLFNLMAGKTVIAIAHRLSTIAAMDRLIVLNQGRIVEEGDHVGLLRRGGLYADLWSRQSGGFLPTEKPRRAAGETLSANESA